MDFDEFPGQQDLDDAVSIYIFVLFIFTSRF